MNFYPFRKEDRANPTTTRALIRQLGQADGIPPVTIAAASVPADKMNKRRPDLAVFSSHNTTPRTAGAPLYCITFLFSGS